MNHLSTIKKAQLLIKTKLKGVWRIILNAELTVTKVGTEYIFR